MERPKMQRRTVLPEADNDAAVQHRMRILSENREAKAHAAAAALDECLTLLLLALQQAAANARGMQARRARRLHSKFKCLRLAALDGKSPCAPQTLLENIDEAVDRTSRLVR